MMKLLLLSLLFFPTAFSEVRRSFKINPDAEFVRIGASSRNATPTASVIATGAPFQRISYGGECNKTAKCDSKAWLTCSEGTCECIKPDAMVYVKELDSCMSKAGERCKFAVGGSDIYDDAPCVPHAICSAKGFCMCGSRYYETEGGYCTIASDLGERCDSRVKCSAYKALYCHSDGSCKCYTTVAEYDYGLGQCVGLAGKSCINNECTDHASCVRGTCICGDDYYKDASGRCQRRVPVKQSCSADYQCEQKPFMELKCVKGFCDCDPSTSMYATVYPPVFSNTETYRFNGWRTSSGNATQCVPLAGLPCIKGLCTPGAACVYDRNYDYYGSAEQQRANGTCHCMPGRLKSKNNKCGYTVSTSCTTGDDCFEGLVCKNKKCSCRLDTQLFRPTDNTCYSKAGGPCTADNECDSNAACQRLLPWTIGHCKCLPGFVANFTGDCEVAFGRPCSDKKDCDSIAGLDCINSMCQCGGFQKYDTATRKCLGRVGSSCDPSLKNECVENANCTVKHPKLRAVCECNSGSVEQEDYTCSKPQPIRFTAVEDGDAEVLLKNYSTGAEGKTEKLVVLPSFSLVGNVLEEE